MAGRRRAAAAAGRRGRSGVRRARAPAALLLVLAATGPGLEGQSGALRVERVSSAALAGNVLGEPADVEVAVYTPPGYGSGEARYPVLYRLHGIAGTFRDWTEGGYQGLRIAGELDRLVGGGALPPMIVVMPTATNRYLGGYYTDSPVTGGWGSFVARELVAWVDASYRTIAEPPARGVAGHSMGGFGAITLAMDFPGVFSTVYAMSPCCLALADDVGATNPAWTRTLAFDDPGDVAAARAGGDLYALAILGILSVATPAVEDGPFHVAFPFRADGAGGVVRAEPTFTRFRDFFPVERADERLAALADLRGLALDAGYADQFPHIVTGTAAFSRRLTELRIPHTYTAYDGDHRNRVRSRLVRVVLPFFAERLARAGGG